MTHIHLVQSYKINIKKKIIISCTGRFLNDFNFIYLLTTKIEVKMSISEQKRALLNTTSH
jgi:hypothetical protein